MSSDDAFFRDMDPDAVRVDEDAPGMSTWSPDDRLLLCYLCGEEGHEVDDCPRGARGPCCLCGGSHAAASCGGCSTCRSKTHEAPFCPELGGES